MMQQQIKLYFDAEKVCLGGVANDWWIANYQGNYWASEFFWLPEGFDPVGKHLDELMQYDKPECEDEDSYRPQETTEIEVPDEVLEGLNAVLKSGTTNMLDVAVVMAQAVALGYTDTADWIQYNKSDYFEGVFRRFVSPSNDTEIKN